MAIRVPLDDARLLALHAQGLATPPEPGGDVGAVVDRLGCLQLDPVATVARSPLLVLRARLRGGTFASHARALERAAYRERVLFDYWCHEASLCHLGDLPLHRWAMRTHVDRLSPARAHRRDWLAENAEFVDHVVEDLRARGPLRARDLEDRSVAAWEWGHWTGEVSSRQTIARLLDQLWLSGQVGVSARVGTERHWDVLERCLPPGALEAADAEALDQAEVVRRGGHARRGPRPAHHGPLHPPSLSRARGPGPGHPG